MVQQRRYAASRRRWTVLATSTIASWAACTTDGDLSPKPAAHYEWPKPGGSPTSCGDGDERPCHVTIGEHDGIVTCLEGTSTCWYGAWSACEGSFVARPAPRPFDADPEASTNPDDVWTLAGPMPCDDPCDPSCHVFDEAPDGGVGAPGAVIGSYDAGGFSGLPGGQQHKLRKEPCNSPANCTGGPECWAACQSDSKCDLVTGECVPWAWTETDPECSGVDLTLGVPCAADEKVPVCNRGNTAAPAGVQVAIYPGNSPNLQSDMAGCNLFGAPKPPSCVTTTAIAPGECVFLTCPLGNGYQSLAVNPNGQVAECRCSNNWSGYHNDVGCSTNDVVQYGTTSYQVGYASQCPPGTDVRWGWLSYSANTPSNVSGASRLRIDVHAAEPPATVAADCSDCATLADTAPPTSDPPFCGAASTPPPCPKDVYAALGGLPAAASGTLELVFTLTPTPDKLLAPVLKTWQLTYSCVPVE